VALRGVTETGFLIYTNLHSQKSVEMQAHHRVAMTFYWPQVFRQIRIRGNAIPTSKEQSDLYFASRPRGSQVGAWTSRQSETLTSRAELEEQYQKFVAELGETIERPPFWGGFEITPDEFEFMQGHENRLHDRFRFTFNSSTKTFDSQRLWP
jgi:pyridoxamine 5'-phosphate oxidase